MTNATAFPQLCRQWRRRRRLSQLDLAERAAVSQRHLSWLETGRSRPSRGMVLRIAEALEVPLRERNTLLMDFAATYATQTSPCQSSFNACALKRRHQFRLKR